MVLGVSFQLTGRKSYGDAGSLDAAKAVLRAGYDRWQREADKTKSPGSGDAQA
jgi:hypothetical protein